ncbi:MAG: CoA transferase [Rhodospirillaceae bacterium]
MKLEGLRVIDLSMYLPGPHLTLMMADHGADVLRVEPPGGEPARKYGPFQAGHSVWFRNTHRGKRSICLNLKDDTDRETLLKLCETADVFVEAFRPGVVRRLGVDYDAVKARNPKIVYCSVSAFGQTGPLSGKPTHDMGAQALTGLLALNDNGDGKPVVPGLPGADMGSSLIGLAGIMMALYRRQITGEGDYVDASMYDSLLSWTAHLSGSVLAENKAPTTREGRSIGGAAFYNVYETRDGRFIALTGREPKFVKNLLTKINLEHLIEVCSADDCVAQESAKKEIAETFKTKTQQEWIEILEPLDLSWAPVLNMAEAFQLEHAKARGMIIQDDAGITHVGNPIKFKEEPAVLKFDVPEFE